MRQLKLPFSAYLVGLFRANRIALLRAFGLAVLLSALTAHSAEKALCPGLILRGDDIPSFSDTERRLLCGDPQSHAWKEIPANQVRYFLRNFLQDRGYFQPEFHSAENAQVVEIGNPTRVSRFMAMGAPRELDVDRKRKVVGEILTPQLLNVVEQWVRQRLEALGYPCPEVKTEADPVSGFVVARVKAGPQQLLFSVQEASVTGLADGLFRRYDAFRLGETFNGDLLTVTSNRLVWERLVDSAYFSSECGMSGATARQEILVPPPRLLTAGFGLSTEGLVEARVSWKNSRLGRMASQLEFTGFGSAREQRVVATQRWYHLPYVTRRHLRPNLTFRHQDEEYFETLSAQGGLAVASSWDNQKLGAQFSLGPVLEFVRTLRGASGLQNTRLLSLEASLSLESHYFEFFRLSPRTGFRADLLVDLSSDKVFSSVTAQRLALNGEVLWNYREYDPPLWIFALRGGVRVTPTDERAVEGSKLPANFLHYLGGSADLRGFGRKALPTDGLGALTSAFVGAEWRAAGYFPYGFQPFVFFDVGALGKLPWALDSPLYTSPGVGLRWESTIGVFRTTLAHGIPARERGGLHFYFNYGEEF